MRATRRPQNVCKSCGYTWNPRGHNLSPNCPRCGGTKVRIVGGGIVLIIALLVLWGICTGGHKKTGETGKSMTPPSVAPVLATTQAQLHVTEPVYAAKPSRLRSEGAAEPSPKQAGQPSNKGFWVSEGAITFADGGDCPDELWALFPGEPPGKDEFEKRTNAGHRGELAKRMKQALFVLEREPHGLLIETGGIDLGDYNFRQKLFPAKMEGTASCKLGPGESDVTIAFGPAKAVDESPASDGRVGYHEWKAHPLEYTLRVPEVEAPSFKENHHGPFSAKLAFRIVGIKNHKLMARYGGNRKDIEDYGAGVLVEAKLAAVRIDDGEENLLDTSPKTEAR